MNYNSELKLEKLAVPRGVSSVARTCPDENGELPKREGHGCPQWSGWYAAGSTNKPCRRSPSSVLEHREREQSVLLLPESGIGELISGERVLMSGVGFGVASDGQLSLSTKLSPTLRSKRVGISIRISTLQTERDGRKPAEGQRT